LVDFSVFEYCYCDASNYKVWGDILLQGIASDSDLEPLTNHFDAGEFFIAEQLGIPPLYADLWELSGGPSVDDHVWHTFSELRPATADDIKAQALGTVENFISKIKAVKTWNQTLSPHWDI
jgi:hypothetical protein